ncbi:MAG: glutamine-hydrolyzing carbamoyl-phosphate synthase small subunit [Syntrophaceae bacterium]
MPLKRTDPPALLVLEDGSSYHGYAFAGRGEVLGEVVFNTGMAGYQECLTDPSYKGQILVMTYPLIGNYGVNDDDMESAGIHLEGYIVKEYQDQPSNWRSRRTLKDFLEAHGRLGVDGIDTRSLTKKIRTAGAMRGILSTNVDDKAGLLERVRAYPGLVGQDMVAHVASTTPYLWKDGAAQPLRVGPKDRLRVVVLDCGVKYNILRHLEALSCEVMVVPSRTAAKDILALEPDGIMLSNGPGDPEPITYAVETIRALLGKKPIFGICLGHQLLGLAVGGRTSKLKFGHHGVNQPVKNIATGRIEISSQNHGFVVLTETLPKDTVVTHTNLNDGTLEGLAYPGLKAFSVQYHPEASPGPFDANYLFQDFLTLMKTHAG